MKVIQLQPIELDELPNSYLQGCVDKQAVFMALDPLLKWSSYSQIKSKRLCQGRNHGNISTNTLRLHCIILTEICTQT